MSTPEGAALRLTLYGRRYCHLCDDMRQQLESLPGLPRFEVDWVDVDAFPELEARYGERVPVLVHADRELCHFFLDVPAVTAYLDSIR